MHKKRKQFLPGPPIEQQRASMKAIIVNDAGHVLLLEENGSYKYAANGGKWQVPGGKIELGESPAACLLEEIWEETGLTASQIEIGEPIGYGDWRPIIEGLPRAQIVGIFVVCRLTDHDAVIKVEAKKHRRGLWVDKNRFDQLNTAKKVIPPDNEMVAKFFSSSRTLIDRRLA